MKLCLLFHVYNDSYDFNLYIYNSIGCSKELFGFHSDAGNLLQISVRGNVDRLVRYCTEEHSISEVSDEINFYFATDISEKYNIELGELMELYSNDLGVMRSKLKELQNKYQQMMRF